MKKIPVIFLACVLAFLPTLVIGQVGVVIEGTVTDNVGNPLPGANIFIQGTTYGAAAGGRKGAYEFTLPAELALGQDVDLHAQFIGFRSKTVKITLNPGTITQNFELEVDVLELESIVVTGLGETLVKEKLGVSIAIVKPKVVRRSGESNVVQALAGKAAGVVVRETSGDPGTNSFIRIRGGASIDQNTQPLFVVDGVPINNQTLQTNLDSRGNGGTESTNRAADLNTEDIESIEILKGPAASAIYGSRASNGVVLITTKSGKPGRTKISYKLNIGSTTRSSGYPLQQWFGQGTKGAFRRNYSRSWGRPLNVPGAPHYDASQPEDVIYDHLDEISTSGWSNENNITLSGGQQNTSFFISFGRIYEQGYWKADRDVINSYVSRGDIAENFFGLLSDKSEPASYERYTARIKASQVINEKIKLTANLAYANTEGRYLQRGDNAIGMMLGTLRTPPEFNNWPYIDANTGFHRSYRFSEADELRKSRRFDNPFFIMYEHENPRDVGRLYGYLRAEYDMLDWLQFKYTLGSDYSSDDATALNPPSGSREDGVGRIRRVNFTTHEIDANLLAIIKGEKFLSKFENIDATFLLGHNINRREFKRLQTQGVDFGVPGFNQLDNTVSTNLSSNEFESLIHTESFFGQMTVDLYDQLYLTGALRNDGSSTFGASKRRHWYPKISGAWDFSKSIDVPLVNFGKLRAAYGESGVQPGVYDTISGFSTGGKGFGIFTSTSLNTTYRGKSGYFSSSNKGNDDISPERTQELEFGTNLAFWDSRIGLDLTYYRQKSTDVIFDLNVVPSSGFFSQTDNGATIENNGWELTLDVAPIRKRNFTWDVGVTYARNKNEVTIMRDRNGVPVFEGIGRWAFAGEGHELGELRLNTFVRFGRDDLNDGRGESIDGVFIDEEFAGEWKKGDVYIPADGFPKMSGAVMWSGLSANPDWTGGIRNEFTLFNNFSISAFIDIAQGHHIMNHGAGALFSYGTHFGTADRGQTKSIPLNGKNGTHPFDRDDVKGIGPGAVDGVPIPVELTESWYRSAGAGFSGDGFQFTEDASYVKLREISVSYRLQNRFVRRLGLSDMVLILSGRNLKTWTDYTGFDPETNRRQASNARDSDYFNQPQARTYSFTLRMNY